VMKSPTRRISISW